MGKAHIFTLLIALALAGCGIEIHDHPASVAPVSANLDQVRRTIDALPTNEVLWEHHLDVTRVRRVTLGVEHLYVEADKGMLIAISRRDGMVAWMYGHRVGHIASWPPVEVGSVVHNWLDMEAQEQKLLASIRRLSRKTKLTDAELDQLDALRNQRSDIGGRIQLDIPYDNLYFVTDNILHCLQRRSGRLLWTRRLTYSASARPAASRAVVYISSAAPPRVNAHSVDDKGRRFTFYRAAMTARDNFVTESPIYDEPNIIFPSNDGTIYAFDASSTSGPGLAWLFNTDDTIRGPLSSTFYTEERLEPGGTVRSVGHQLVFATALNKNLYAIETGAGALFWKMNLGGYVNSPVIVSGDTLYVRVENDALMALDVAPAVTAEDGTFKRTQRTGRLRWQLPAGRRFVLRLKDRRVLVMGPRRQLYEMDDSDGRVRNRHSTFGLDYVLTNTGDGVLYVVTRAGRIFALREHVPQD